MDETLLFSDFFNECLVDASKFGLVLLFELRCLLFVILFFLRQVAVEAERFGLINQHSLAQLGRMGGRWSWR